MNEAQTRHDLIDPKLKEAGWGVIDTSKVVLEYYFTDGKIKTSGGRDKPLKADYILIYKNRKIAVIEAKPDEKEVGEGVGQAKEYAEKLHIRYTYSCNGHEIYKIDMDEAKEGLIDKFPSPEELWEMTFPSLNTWHEKFNETPFEDVGGTKKPRFYQEIAVNKTLEAIAEGEQKLLLTLATGTGKTLIAFQIACKHGLPLFPHQGHHHLMYKRNHQELF